MKKIFLGGKYGSIIGNYVFVDDEDYERLNKHRWYLWRNKKKDTLKLYAIRAIYPSGKTIYMHRVILAVPSKKIDIDHKNHNGLDNRKKNLRICSRSENQQNSRKQKNKTSIYKGVSLERKLGKWRSEIMTKIGKKFLGYFKDEKKAARAYNQAAVKYFKKFHNINKII